jgi:hypothetical protein
MNLTEWKTKHGVITFDYNDPESDGYHWTAQPRARDGRLIQGQGTTEFAACYALASKLQVEGPEEGK